LFMPHETSQNRLAVARGSRIETPAS
jgi:hypothetical protein